ncbi:hypothetical protein ABBQ38_006889 [Trebouxia sp. C0009 RCD-2024]
MSELQQNRGSHISTSSRWTLLPVDVLRLIIPLLPRDGVASTAKVWPQAVDDQRLRLFVPGGMPICEDCFNSVVSISVPELVKHEQQDPTGTIALLPDDDDVATFMIQDDVITLFVAGFLDKVCKQPGVGACLLCLHKQDFLAQLSSQDWQSLLGKYACRLSSDLKEFYEESYDSQYGLQVTVYESWVLPVVCPRCGNLDCDHSSNCRWFYGEGWILQKFQDTLLENHRIKVNNMAPCACHKRRKGSAKEGRCACQHCNRTPARFCNFCARCCRNKFCHHTNPPKQAKFDHRFITGIAGACPAVPVALPYYM